MKPFLTLLILLTTFSVQAHKRIYWNKDYQLQLSDFRSPATQIHSGVSDSVQMGPVFNSIFRSSKGGMIYARNFNRKVTCTIRTKEATLLAPDSMVASDLLEFARFEFDLCELYARKYRKQLSQVSGAFSKNHFFHFYNEEIRKEFAKRHSQASQSTDMGRNREKLATLRKEVAVELDQLSEYCRSCKIVKNKKEERKSLATNF